MTVSVVDAFIAFGSTIQVGKSVIAVDPLDDSVATPLWSETRLHNLLGASAAMRRLLELINCFAAGRPLRREPTNSDGVIVAVAILRACPLTRGGS